MRLCLSFALLASALLTSCGGNPFASKESMVTRGNQFFEQNKLDDAVLQYRRALQKDQQYAEAYYRVALVYERQSKLPDAILAFTRASELASQNALYKTELANRLLNIYLSDQQRPKALYDRLERIADELSQADPKSFTALRIKGYLASTNRQPDLAITAFQQANQVRPDQPDVITILVENYFLAGKLQQGEDLAAAFQQRNPGYGPLYDILYNHYIGLNQPAKAEEIVVAKANKNPKNLLFQIQLAEYLSGKGRAAEMESLLQRLLANRNDFPDVHLRVGELYARLGKPAEALNTLQDGERLNLSQAADYRKRQALIQLGEGRLKEAASLLDTVLAANPNDEDAQFSRASVRLATTDSQDIQKGLETLKALAKAHPDNVSYQHFLGRAYRRAGQDEPARAQYAEVLKLNANHVDTLRELADIFLKREDPGQALPYAERALQVDPNNAAARLARTACWGLMGRYGDTRAELNRIVAAQPNLREAHLQLATLSVAEKRYAEAEQIFRKYYEPGLGDFRALRGLTSLYLAQNQPKRAVAVVQEEIKRFPNMAALSNLLATTSQAAGEFDVALDTNLKLLQQTPESPEVLLRLGALYRQRGDLTNAIRYLEKAAKLDPKSPQAQALLGEALAEAGKPNEAIAAYRAALQLAPEDPVALNNLAFQLADSGKNLDEALTLTKKAMDRLPNNPALMDTLGWIYFRRGDDQSAIQTLRASLAKDPDNALVRMHLVRLRMNRGELAEAKSEIANALSRKLSDRERKDFQQMEKDLAGRR